MAVKRSDWPLREIRMRILGVINQLGCHDFVALVEVHGDQSGLAWAVVVGQTGLFDQPDLVASTR